MSTEQKIERLKTLVSAGAKVWYHTDAGEANYYNSLDATFQEQEILTFDYEELAEALAFLLGVELDPDVP